MKKILAIILSITLLFSFMAIPASAELGESDASISISDVKSIFERISDVFHELIAKIFKAFGADCPLCENHDGYGEAGGDGDFNKAEIAKQYNEAVNQLKAHKKTLKIEHISNVKKVELSGATLSLQKAINDILEDMLGRNDETYTFKNNESAKISALIPPQDREATLSGAYVDYINFYKANDDTKIEFELMDSKSTFNGTSTILPDGYSEVLEPINLGSFDLEDCEIIHAEITYADTSVEAVLNVNGKVKSLKTASVITINATVETNSGKSVVTLILDCADEYKITY